ncbi:MFS transporter [Leadbetterella byssophila]|jgi:FHS family L-fucose permease-like MFS transporter|uniref:Major facilitator superfamily MFS_1 n=1 Tax=Leadbetterella byssophila (strain DSM 17132 / JCM 16389 / KACC 11308 / NBRC 106382 / 4M15) TaxID=649349 RepID=E4RYY6_LEAB4|nr:MFS transporter [Leadbetterella byssophila]ADQ18205.1 major facilitator superfamily MFS_1 [Leadbetterella byssophila DSM 17132]
MENNKTNLPALYTLVTVWFFWSFVAASNGILIPLFKEKFDLLQWQAQLVDFAFYAAYFVGSVIYLLLSAMMKTDILNKIGYKNGIIYGLIISAVGSMIFYPAAESKSYFLLLTALFVVGLGFSLQQTATQPFMIALGPPETGATRINLGGAVNNFGGTVGPLIVSFAIFRSVSPEAAHNATIESVKFPYLVLGVLFILLALFFWVSKLPRITNDEEVEAGVGVLKFPQVILGMSAIFVYVGVEVTVGSNLPEYLKETQGLVSSQVSKYVAMFWGSMMVGRWTAAVGNFGLSEKMKKIMWVVVPFVAFGIVLYVNSILNGDVSDLYMYSFCVLVMIISFFVANEKPVKTLLIFTGMGAVMTLIGIFTTGQLALYCLISGGLFCSILWPSIFSLGTAGLGKYTNQGAAFMIMMILGGAVVPVLQGLLADKIGIQLSYLLAVACFAYLFWFGVRIQQVLRKQNIDFDQKVSSAKGGH